MELYSLEEDDASHLFITQESKNDNVTECSGSQSCSNEDNGKSNVENSDGVLPAYSNISDKDMDVFQCSQQPRTPLMNSQRKVMGRQVGVGKKMNLVNRGLSHIIGMNARKWNGLKIRPSTAKTVSRQRKFSFTNDACIEDLKQIRLKKKTESKVNWAVSAYNDWRNARLYNYQYDVGIYEADLNDLPKLTKENLQHALCYFVPEVSKVKGEGLYPGRTLYEMVVAIQKYLRVNKIFWDLIEGPEFIDLHTVLDNVMQERTAMNIGIVKKQAQVISYETEQMLWSKGFLGEESSDKLRNTVLFLIGINVYLHTVEEHYYLRRPTPEEPSQLSFELNDKGKKCLVYREDTITKTHNGGLADMRRERKVVWVYPSENPMRCPVRLVEKYLSLCPPYHKKTNFYLQSLNKPTPSRWYSSQIVGQQSIGKVIKEIMNEAKIEGFFTNHSLHRTGGTRLFRAGVERKLVKEVTSHRSDSVDAYQVTSDEQCENLCNIIARPPSATVSVNPNSYDNAEVQVIDDKNEKPKAESSGCNINVDESNVGQILGQLMKELKKGGKTKIKLQIEISNE